MERVVCACVTRGERTQWKDRPGNPDGFLGEARHQFRQATAFQTRTAAQPHFDHIFVSISPLFRDARG